MEEVKKELADGGCKEEDMDAQPAISSVAIPEHYERSQLPDLLRVYYTWLFPYDKYFEWLQYGKQCTSHRQVIWRGVGSLASNIWGAGEGHKK